MGATTQCAGHGIVSIRAGDALDTHARVDRNAFLAQQADQGCADGYPATKPAAEEAWRAGQVGKTGLSNSQDSNSFQISAPVSRASTAGVSRTPQAGQKRGRQKRQRLPALGLLHQHGVLLQKGVLTACGARRAPASI